MYFFTFYLLTYLTLAARLRPDPLGEFKRSPKTPSRKKGEKERRRKGSREMGKGNREGREKKKREGKGKRLREERGTSIHNFTTAPPPMQ